MSDLPNNFRDSASRFYESFSDEGFFQEGVQLSLPCYQLPDVKYGWSLPSTYVPQGALESTLIKFLVVFGSQLDTNGVFKTAKSNITQQDRANLANALEQRTLTYHSLNKSFKGQQHEDLKRDGIRAIDASLRSVAEILKALRKGVGSPLERAEVARLLIDTGYAPIKPKLIPFWPLTDLAAIADAGPKVEIREVKEAPKDALRLGNG